MDLVAMTITNPRKEIGQAGDQILLSCQKYSIERWTTLMILENLNFFIYQNNIIRKKTNFEIVISIGNELYGREVSSGKHNDKAASLIRYLNETVAIIILDLIIILQVFIASIKYQFNNIYNKITFSSVVQEIRLCLDGLCRLQTVVYRFLPVVDVVSEMFQLGCMIPDQL